MNPRTHASFSDPTYPPRAQAKSVTILRSGRLMDNNVGVEYTEPESVSIPSSASKRPDQEEGEKDTSEKEIGESNTHLRRVDK